MAIDRTRMLYLVVGLVTKSVDALNDNIKCCFIFHRYLHWPTRKPDNKHTSSLVLELIKKKINSILTSQGNVKMRILCILITLNVVQLFP